MSCLGILESCYISAIFRQVIAIRAMRKAFPVLALVLAACSNYSANLPSIKPYKMDIQQGNVVTPKMMMQLRPGMTKAQVRFIMGTPLIADSFHANRWDYFYQMRKDGKIIEQRRVIMEFEDDKLKRVRGDVVPAGSGVAESLPDDRPAAREPIVIKPGDAAKPKEKGVLDKLKFWESDEPQKPVAAPAQPEVAKPAEAAPPVAQPALPDASESADSAEAPTQSLPPLTQPDTSLAEPEAAASPAPETERRPISKATPQAEKPSAPSPATKPEAGAEPKPIEKPAKKGADRPIEVPREASAKADPPKPKVEPRPVPRSEEDLPPEEDPGYFEKMLEKIGF